MLRTAALHAVFAVAAALQSFTVSTAGAQTSLRFPMLNSVGSGHLALATRTDYAAALAAVQRDIGFGMIRGHGVLDDDMSSYLGGRANMYNVFLAYDAMLKAGTKPLVELSFMPQALALNPGMQSSFLSYRANVSPPASYADWFTFIAEWVGLLVQRYGADGEGSGRPAPCLQVPTHPLLTSEVRTWRFEVWNEPGGCGFFCPPANASNLDAYLALYNSTARAVKSVNPFLQVCAAGVRDG